MYFPAARTEIQGEQNHTEYQLSNSTQLSVTLKPAVIDAVFFLYGWLAQCGRASPPCRGYGVSPLHLKTVKPALRIKER